MTGLLARGHFSKPVTAVTYLAAVLADSPVGYYRLGESSGSTMVDSSGNTRDGSYTGTLTKSQTSLLSGDADTCISFGGGYGEVAAAAMPQPSTWTLEAIIKPSNLSSYHGIVTRDGNTVRGPNMYTLGTNIHLYDLRGGGAIVTGSVNISTSSAWHVAITYDGDKARIYINGVLDATSSATSGSLGAVHPLIGMLVGASYAGTATPTFVASGLIDEAAYYDSALLEARLLVHAQAAGLA